MLLNDLATDSAFSPSIAPAVPVLVKLVGQKEHAADALAVLSNAMLNEAVLQRALTLNVVGVVSPLLRASSPEEELVQTRACAVLARAANAPAARPLLAPLTETLKAFLQTGSGPVPPSAAGTGSLVSNTVQILAGIGSTGAA